MLYVQFWSKEHAVPAENAKKAMQKIKFEEDLDIIRHFDEKYEEFRNQAKNPTMVLNDKKDSDSSLEEITDTMEVINKALEKANEGSKVHVKPAKKLNPYQHAQQEFKKSRIVSKRLNTLSIFVKKDQEQHRQHDPLFEDDSSQPQSRNRGINNSKNRYRR